MITNMKDKYLETSAQFVEDVFTDSEGKESAKIVKQLVLEIRSKRFYLPELEFRISNIPGFWNCCRQNAFFAGARMFNGERIS